MGFSYNVLASMLVPLIVVLAIADDVHIMQHWDEERRHGDVEHAFKATVAHLTAPLLGASATTALGMLSLATSDVVAVRSFGIGSAVGIMVDFAISLVLMPTLLTLVKPETAETPHERYLLPPLRAIARLSTRIRAACSRSCVAVAADRRRAFCGCGSTPTTSTSSAEPPARPVGRRDRPGAGRRLQLPDHARRAARLASTPDALQRIDRLQNELRRFRTSAR